MIWLLALQLALTPQRHVASAAAAFSGVRLQEAEEEIDAALRADPYFVSALILRAKLALFAGRSDVARASLIKAIVGDPASAEAQLYLGVVYYVRGEFQLALPAIERARSLAPLDPMCLLYLAMSYEAIADANKALPLYEEAEHLSVSDAQQNALIRTAHGKLLSALGKYRESVAEEEQAVQEDGKSRDAHYQLAVALHGEHRNQRAAEEADLALTLPGAASSDAEIHTLLEVVEGSLGRVDRVQHSPRATPRVAAPSLP